MEIWVAILGLFIASWQLYLQRKEIEKATNLERLKVAADIIRSEIDLREKIIANEKIKANPDWYNRIQPHVDKVNKTLRPSLRAVTKKIIDLHGGKIDELKTLSLYDMENDRPI